LTNHNTYVTIAFDKNQICSPKNIINMAREFLIGQFSDKKGNILYTLFEKTETTTKEHLTRTFGGDGTLAQIAKELLRVKKSEAKKSHFAETAFTLSSIPKTIFVVQTDSSLGPLVKPVGDEVMEKFYTEYRRIGKY